MPGMQELVNSFNYLVILTFNCFITRDLNNFAHHSYKSLFILVLGHRESVESIFLLKFLFYCFVKCGVRIHFALKESQTTFSLEWKPHGNVRKPLVW